jgi:hypothetical protein
MALPPEAAYNSTLASIQAVTRAAEANRGATEMHPKKNGQEAHLMCEGKLGNL